MQTGLKEPIRILKEKLEWKAVALQCAAPSPDERGKYNIVPQMSEHKAYSMGVT